MVEQETFDGFCKVCDRYRRFVAHANNSDKVICGVCQMTTTKELLKKRTDQRIIK